MLRRSFLSAGTLLAISSRYRLIAHRGGVVGEGKPENSAEALDAAIINGYWMAEVDVRRSKDGEPILYHDAKFGKYHDSNARPEDLTWKELSSLRPKIQHFDDACARASGKIRLMLDLKGEGWPPAFYSRLLDLMEKWRVPGPVYSLGGPKVLPLFENTIQVSISRDELAKHEGSTQNFFLFELASAMDAESVKVARERQVEPVAAINTFRYTMAKRDEVEGPREDFEKLRRLGVRCYQVDSRYENLFD
jgi:glycerophosphoryl diester phosphodiesterase